MLRSTLNTGLLYITALGALAFLFWAVEDKLEINSKDTVNNTLHSVLSATQDALHIWSDRQKANAENIAAMPEVRQPAARILITNPTSSDEQSNSDRQELRRELNTLVNSHGYLGFSIINLEGVRVASMRNRNVGSMNFVSRMSPALFERALGGEIVITLPVHSDVPLIDSSGEVRVQAATMFALAPLRHYSGKIMGVLALRINPLQEFSAIFARGRSGLSGETYGFDRGGNMLSESRFTPMLKEIGLLVGNQVSMLNIAIRNPGQNLIEKSVILESKNWPHTKMAASAVAGNAGFSLTPYADYRGVPVIGVWLWDEALGLGITTEIDASEAFGNLNTSQSAVRVFAFLVALLIATLFILQEKSRRSAEKYNANLRASKDRAEAANRAKMEFISAMSHDLRTPLNAVIGFSQLLAEGSVQRTDQLQYLGYIVRSGTHLLSLLNEVLEFAKLDIGELNFDTEKCNPKDLIEDSLAMVKELANSNRISLMEISDYDTIPLVWADNTRVKQILVNFLTNAIKYNRIGGSVYVSVTVMRQQLRFEVRDTGMGVPKEKLAGLWEPFNRIGAEKTAIEGSGIGLAFSKALVEGLSGKIGAESIVGQGSSFWFSLPIANSDNMANYEKSAEAKPDLSGLCAALEGRSILYVEDVGLNQLIIRKMLKDIKGLTLICVETGESGLEILSEKDFDIILADIRLPDMDGFELNRRRKREGLALSVPIIALSADVTLETKEKAVEEGFECFIEKPVLREELLAGMVAALKLEDSK